MPVFNGQPPPWPDHEAVPALLLPAGTVFFRLFPGLRLLEVTCLCSNTTREGPNREIVMRHIIRVLIACAVSVPVLAKAAYIDDRSTPVSLLKSLYNALNAHEYARAWSYFENGPADNFEAYAAGFNDTASIRLVTGTAEADGTAGTTFWRVPAAIEATGKDGKATVFAGCYTIKLVSPTVQDAPYRPMIIEKASIKPSVGTLEEALPANCGSDAAPISQDARLIDDARSMILTSGLGCDEEGVARDPEIHALEWNYNYDPADAPKRVAKVLHFTCRVAAYNIVDTFLLWDEDEGVRPISFAEPELDIRYEDEAQEKLKSISVMGMKASRELINATLEPAEQAIYSASKWRGVGDAGSSGKWIFRDGAFTLVFFEVDPTFDGASDMSTVIDYESAP